MQSLQPRLETLDLGVNNLLCGLRFLLAARNVSGDSILQIVNVIDKNAVELVHRGINVARDCDVNKEHGTVLSLGEKFFAVLPPEDRDRSAGRGNDDVRLLAMFVELVETNGLAAEARGKIASAIVSAVGYKDRASSPRQQMAGSKF